MKQLKWASGRVVDILDTNEFEDSLVCTLTSPIIVIGPPRSGTSTVARILSMYFGVKMGTSFAKPDERNPGGFWEDIDLIKTNNAFWKGDINFEQWTIRFLDFIEKMQNLNVPWGFKEPRICAYFGLVLGFFNNPTIIRCKRLKKLVALSHEKALNRKKEEKISIDRDEIILDRILKYWPHILIEFNKQLSDKDVIKRIVKQGNELNAS